MTMPLMKPRRKNPVLRTRQMNLPPFARGRTALGMTAAAAEGRFELQVCRRCQAVQYPPRDACHRCLSPRAELDAAVRRRRAAQRDRAPPQQRSVLPRAAAVAARPRAPRRRADGDRPPARRRAAPPFAAAVPRRHAGARPRRRAPRPRRRRGADRIPCRGERTHGRRQDAARDDQRPQVPEDPRHRRQDRGRPGARQGARQGRRRDRLGRPCRAMEEAAGPRRHHRAAAGDAGAARPDQRPLGRPSSPARSAARSTSSSTTPRCTAPSASPRGAAPTSPRPRWTSTTSACCAWRRSSARR